ncbi:MAG: hypothetical protein JW857_08740 [Bacteroidales bacterium]|nr:hypothetical protein [Bacteroidales bacterium]
MPRNFTLEDFYPNSPKNKKMKFQEIVNPDVQSIRNVLAYSKALSVLESQRKGAKQKAKFYLILN